MSGLQTNYRAGFMRRTLAKYFFIEMLFLIAILPANAQNPAQRGIAITIDDLPAAGANSMTGAEIVEMTTKLLRTLRDRKICRLSHAVRTPRHSSKSTWNIQTCSPKPEQQNKNSNLAAPICASCVS